jgi:hypothetical protein
MENMLEALQKDLNIPSFSLKCKDSGEQLSISVFNGRAGLTVWPPRESNTRGVVFKQNFTPEAQLLFKRALRNTADATPGTRNSLLFNKWDSEAKKFIPEATIVIGKDDKNIFFIELQFQYNGNNKVLKFDMYASNAVQNSSEELGFPEKSRLRLDAIIEYFDTLVPIAQIITGRKFVPKPNSSGGPAGFGQNNSY